MAFSVFSQIQNTNNQSDSQGQEQSTNKLTESAPSEKISPPAETSKATSGATNSVSSGTVAPVQESSETRTPQPVGEGIASTGTLRGKVPVPIKKPMSAVKDYGSGPAFKVQPPDPPMSAVWVGAGQPPLDPSKTSVLKFGQKGFQFRPGLLVVQTGTPVTFPNEDPLYHSVFSYSPIKRLDLGRYRQGEEPPAVVMDKPGMIQLFCEIHEHMRGTILVVDTPWFAVTDPEGNFEIQGIPTGKYPVKVWISAKEILDKEVEILAGQILEVDWQKAQSP